MIKILTVLCLFYSLSYGMDCSFGKSDNVIDQVIHSCPKPIIDSSDKQYCCPTDDSFRCCDLSDFLVTWLGVVWIYVVIVVVACIALSLICCCVRSLCR